MTTPLMQALASNRGPNLKPYISSVGILAGLAVLLPSLAITAWLRNPVPVLAGALVALYLLLSIKVAAQWERAAVLRLGRYIGLRGPGIFMIVPVIDTTSTYVDQRVRVTDV